MRESLTKAVPCSCDVTSDVGRPYPIRSLSLSNRRCQGAGANSTIREQDARCLTQKTHTHTRAHSRRERRSRVDDDFRSVPPVAETHTHFTGLVNRGSNAWHGDAPREQLCAHGALNATSPNRAARRLVAAASAGQSGGVAGNRAGTRKARRPLCAPKKRARKSERRTH